MDYIKELTSLGLTYNEARVYTCLLEIGPSSPTKIERETHIHRPLVYKALTSLQQRRLVSINPRGKRKNYAPASPDKLIEIFRKIEDGFLSKIEDLHNLYEKPQSPRPIVTYAEGEQAIRDGYMDVIKTLNKGDIYYRYSPGYDLFDRKRFLPKAYKEMRDQKQLERFIIVNDRGDKKHNLPLGKQVKAVPKSFDLFNDRIGFAIYKDKIMIADYESKSAITIKHQKLADFQKKLFKLLYSKL
ncbi:hypothetical protein EB052_01670 [bacterium]|nr:hypothetical protein [bacterium]